MRSIIQFFMRFGTIFVFIILEGFSLYLIVQFNENQQSIFNNTFLIIQGNVQERYQSTLNYLSLKDQIDSLRRENARLRKEAFGRPEMRVALVDSLEYTPQDSTIIFDYIPAQVISNSLHFRHNNITLDEGSSNQIEEGMGVIGDKGVVGIVRNVTRNYASVLPLIHVNSSVSAKIKRSDYFGNVEWKGGSHKIANLNAVPKHADVRKGDTVVTSGYSVIFPEGLPIGTIQDIELPPGSNFYQIEVSLFVDFGNLRYVYVVDNKREEELLQLENEVGDL